MNRLQRWKRRLALGLVAASVCVSFWLLGGMSSFAGKKEEGKKESKGAKPGWTMFGGSHARLMVNPDAKGLPVEWSLEEGAEKNIIWKADLGSKAYGGPVVFEGRVFIGTNNQNPRDKKLTKTDPKSGKVRPIDLGVVMAFDEQSGKFLYQTTFTKLESGRVNDWPEEGICSTPVIEGDRYYYVSNRCEVVCADTATGKFHWKLDMIGQLGVFPHNIAVCSPLLVGDSLWVVTANGVDEGHINVPRPAAPSFIKVDKNNGKVLWEYNEPTVQLLKQPKGADQEAFFKRLVDRGQLIQHGQWSNPAYAKVDGQDQFIFPGGDGWVYSFDEKGKELWKFDCNPKNAKYELAGRGTRNDFIATPVIYKDRVYIGVGQDPEHETGVGHLWCIDMKKRGDVSPELVEDYSTDPPKTKKNPNSALVWHYGGFTSKEDFKKIRRRYYFGRTMSTCAIKDDILYTAELLGIVHALDANTGKVLWTHDTRSPIWSSPYWADGKIYMGTDGGTVFIFEHGKTKKILAENDMQGRVRATPVAVGDTLFVMTENRLYCIRNKKD